MAQQAPSRFVDDNIENRPEDINKVQEAAHMYIGYSGALGAFHLSKEGINNAIDECINPNSPGDEVGIFFDEVTNEIIVTDNGRGIPFESLITVCTTLQSSGKFKRQGVGATAGQNGVGLTVENGLSESFELISHRYGEKASIKFHNGKLIQDLTITKDKSNRHGTTVKFIPSKYFLGEDCNIEPSMISDWVEDIICLVPPTITVTFSANRKGKESAINKKYRNKDGLASMCKKFTEKLFLEPIHFARYMNLKENVRERDEETGEFTFKEVERTLDLEVAFTYNSVHTGELAVKSFCNFVTTKDGGEHVEGVRLGIVNFIRSQASDLLSEKDKKNYDVIPQDVMNGLSICMNLATDMTPEFGGQVKEKVNNKAFTRPLREMTFRACVEHFKKYPKELKKITDYVRANARARFESNRVKNSVLKGERHSLSLHEIPFYCPPNKKGKNDYSELFIVEGESAYGPTKRGRFAADIQGVFGVRGVGLNSFGKAPDIVIANDELRNLVKVLGCQIGEAFKLEDCKFDKIIILTDGDTDGFFISSLLCAFFVDHLPGLVEAGRIYKAISPLYQTSDKKEKFVVNKERFAQLFEERIGDNIKLINLEDNTVMKNKNLQNFLLKNRDYLEELIRTASHYAISIDLMEFVAVHATDAKFNQKLKVDFPEMELDKDNIVSGIHEGRYQILNIDKLLRKRISNLNDLIVNVNEGNIYYGFHEKTSSGYVDRGRMSIGQILFICQKYRPRIIKRFKGLGELNFDQLTATTLDPTKRTLIQLTINDMRETYDKFKVLHGKESSVRAELMSSYQFKREDLDN